MPRPLAAGWGQAGLEGATPQFGGLLALAIYGLILPGARWGPSAGAQLPGEPAEAQGGQAEMGDPWVAWHPEPLSSDQRLSVGLPLPQKARSSLEADHSCFLGMTGWKGEQRRPRGALKDGPRTPEEGWLRQEEFRDL